MLATVLLFALLPCPAQAAEAVTALSLADMEKLALANNRIAQKYQANRSLAEHGYDQAATTREDLSDTQASVYAQQETAYKQDNQIRQGLQQVGTALTQIEQTVTAQVMEQVANGALSKEQAAAAISQALSSNAQYVAYSAQQNVLLGQQMQLSSGLSEAQKGLDELDDGFLQVDATLTNLENTRDDLEKAQADWQTEVKLLVRLLAENALVLEETYDLLWDNYTWQQQRVAIAEKKYALGLATHSEVTTAKQEATAVYQQMLEASSGLTAMKRQLNDLMGRDWNTALAIAPIAVSEEIQTAPLYSEQLYKQLAAKDQTIKTLKREIDDQHKQASDYKDTGGEDSDKLAMYDDRIRLAQIAIADEQAALNDTLKKQIAAIRQAQEELAYQKTALEQAEKTFAQSKRSREVGLLAEVSYQGAELLYRQAQIAYQQALYAYDLRWQEYQRLQAGVQLVAYPTYQAQMLF